VPAVGIAARGLVAALGALAIMLARGTAVGFVAWREKVTLGNVALAGAVVSEEAPGTTGPEGRGALPDCGAEFRAVAGDEVRVTYRGGRGWGGATWD
jgi:hypothetical protein